MDKMNYWIDLTLLPKIKKFIFISEKFTNTRTIITRRTIISNLEFILDNK